MNTLKRASFSVIVFFYAVFFPGNISAQLSWQWGRTASGVGESYLLAADNMGNVFAAGSSIGTTAIFDTITVPTYADRLLWAKYNAAGIPLWASGTSYGGGNSIAFACDPAGNLLIYGKVGNDIGFGSFILSDSFVASAESQYFLVKISPSGTVLWALNDGELANADDAYYEQVGKYGDVTADDSGNIYVAGEFKKASMTIGGYTLTNTDPSGTTNDIFIAKYSPSGTLLWATSAGGAANDNVLGITASATEVCIAGGFRSPSITIGSSVITNPNIFPRAWLAKFSPAGAPLWAQAGGGSHAAYCIGVKHDNAGNIYIAGNFSDSTITFGTYTITPTVTPTVPNYSVFAAKYSPADAMLWGRSLSAHTTSVFGYSCALSPCGQMWVNCSTNSALVTSPGDTLHISGTDPVVVVGFDESGGLFSSTFLKSGGDDNHGIACDPMGNVFFCGDFEPSSVVVGPDTLVGSPIEEQFILGKYGKVPDTVGLPGEPITHCGNDTLTLNGPADAAWYLWNDGITTTQSRTVSAAGYYWVYAAYCGDSVVADSFHVIFYPLPAAIAGPSIICVTDTATFTDSTAGGVWQSGTTAVATIGAGTGEARGISAGTTTITYMLTTGCLATLPVMIAGCEGVQPVVIDETIHISPNPAADYLTITTSPGVYTSCSIFNNVGQVVITQAIASATTQINIATLPPGIYYVRLTGQGDTRVGKIVVSR